VAAQFGLRLLALLLGTLGCGGGFDGRLCLLLLGHAVTANWQVHRTVVGWSLRWMTTVSKPSQSPHGVLNAGPFLPTSTSRGRLVGVGMEKPRARLTDCCTEIPL
jgi:hypothetical protein